VTAMPVTTPEPDVLAALAAALAPVPVWWGYAPAEDVETPPTLPLVTLNRTAAIVRQDWADMCEEGEALPADVTLQVHVWHLEYGAARALQRTVRSTLHALVGWAALNEFDVRNGDLRAWSIQSDWQGTAIALD
jgi:hypothetical protein